MNSTEDSSGGAPVGRAGSGSAPRVRRTSSAFGSLGSDPTVKRLDLNDAFIRHPEATFQMQAAGNDMSDAGIGDGDVLLVDRAITAQHGSVVIAIVAGELRCRRLEKPTARRGNATSVRLVANPGVAPITINEEAPLEVWGVVTAVIKSLL